MSDVVLAALITVTGMLGVAIVSAIVQVKVTRRVVDAEHKKAMRQVAAEATIRAHEARRERLHVALAELIRISDPELFGRQPDLDALTRAVHEAQLLLIPSRPLEGDANAAVNRVALELSDWTDGLTNFEGLMTMHAELIDRCRDLMAGLHAPVRTRDHPPSR